MSRKKVTPEVPTVLRSQCLLTPPPRKLYRLVAGLCLSLCSSQVRMKPRMHLNLLKANGIHKPLLNIIL
jgi:hypothetical protein